MMELRPNLLGVYLFVEDMDASIAFYELLGLAIERVGPELARSVMQSGVRIELGSAELTRSYDPDWRAPTGPGHNSINFELPTPDGVDALYERLVAAGHRGHLAPCDPPWRARFAIVDDPDGNVIGLHGPRDLEAERARERGESILRRPGQPTTSVD